MNRLQKVISRLTIVVILVAMLIPNRIPNALAAESASIKVSGGSVTKGSSITVKVTVSATVDMEMYEYTLSYDPEYLQYVSGDDDRSENGKLTVIKYDASGKSQTLSFKFKALKVGDAALKIGNATVCPSDPKYGDSLKTSVTGGNVTVKAPYQASSDCTLKSLQVSEGTLSPAFSKSTTEYSVEVSGGTSSLKVTAIANDSKASVKVSGNKDFKEGDNTVKIVVTAENGDTKTYKIKVKRGKMSPTPTPTVGAVVNVGEDKLTIRDKIRASIPEGFEKKSMEYQDFPIECLENLAGNLALVEMSDGNLYVYNAEKNSFSLYTEVSGKTKPIILVDPNADVAIPKGYAAFTRNFAGTQRTVYQTGEESNYFLFRGMNGEGIADWYQYYIPDQSIQLWNQEDIELVEPTPVPTDTVTPTPTPTITPSPLPTPTESAESVAPEQSPENKKDNLRYLGWIVAGFCGLLSLLFLALFLKEKNNKAEELEADSVETEYKIAQPDSAQMVETNNDTAGTFNPEDSEEVSKSLTNALKQEITNMESEDNNSN